MTGCRLENGWKFEITKLDTIPLFPISTFAQPWLRRRKSRARERGKEKKEKREQGGTLPRHKAF